MEIGRATILHNKYCVSVDPEDSRDESGVAYPWVTTGSALKHVKYLRANDLRTS